MRLLLTALAALLIAAPGAHADTGIEYDYLPDSTPVIRAAAQDFAGGGPVRVVEWRECLPGGGGCLPVSGGTLCNAATGRCEAVMRPGWTLAGTSFELVFEVGGVQSTLRTPEWTGAVTTTARPVVSDATVGRAFGAQPATFAGGWAPAPGPKVSTSLRRYVCPTPEGTACFDLSSTPPVLDSIWAGWWAWAFTRRTIAWPHSPLFPKPVPAYVLPIPHPVDRVPRVSFSLVDSAPVQVCCTATAPAADPPPVVREASPSATVRARAQRRNGRLTVAEVRCAIRCAVRLTVKSSRHTIVRSFTVRGTRSLAIPARRGTLRVSVRVDGKLLAGGRSVAR